MTVETVLRRLSKICRENIAAFDGWEQNPITYTRGNGVVVYIGVGARGEARGTVQTCREMLVDIRRLRREHLKDCKKSQI